MTAAPSPGGPTRVRRTRRAPAAEPRPVSPDHLPAGLVARHEWLAAVPRELDDAVVLQALADLRGDDPGAQNRACATLWRALKPLIQSTEIRLRRIYNSQSPETIFEAIDGAMTTVVLKAHAGTLAAFFSYASETLGHAGTSLHRELRAAARHVSIDDASNNRAARWQRAASDNDRRIEPTGAAANAVAAAASPAGDEVEALLVEAIGAVIALPHQRAALYHYFGICDYRGRGEKSGAAVGRQHNLSGERVRQLVDRVKSALYAKLGVDEDDDADADE